MKGMYAFYNGTPCWATPSGSACTVTYGCNMSSGALPTESLLVTFTTALVQRYQTNYPGVLDYELFNEPENEITNFPSSGTVVSKFVTLMTDEYNIIRADSSSSTISSPSFVTAAGISAYYTAGGPTGIDVVSHHFEPGGCQVDRIFGSEYLTGVYAANNTAGVGSKPLLDTETSSLCTSYAANEQFVMQDYLLQWSLGTSRLNWYEWYAPTSDYFSMYDGTTVYIDATGYNTLQDWLVGATMSSSCSSTSAIYSGGTFVDNAVWSCPFVLGSGSQGSAVWTSSNYSGSTSYIVPSPFNQYVDSNNTVHSSPIGSSVTISATPILLQVASGAPAPPGLSIFGVHR